MCYILNALIKGHAAAAKILLLNPKLFVRNASMNLLVQRMNFSLLFYYQKQMSNPFLNDFNLASRSSSILQFL